MSISVEPDQSIIDQWLITKQDASSIKMELINLGVPHEEVDEYIKLYKKKILEKRQTKGFIYMAIGAFLGFISYVLTLVNLFPELYGVILYGLTAVAIIIIFIGLYLVFEN